MLRKRYSLLAATALLSLMSYGCTTSTTNTAQAPKPAMKATQEMKATVYKGSVVGKSNKAKTISIKVGKGKAAKTMMVKFDENTKGMEFAKKGEAAIVNWEMRGADKYATVIKPKLAKLPAGVTEVKVDEMHELLESGTPLTLVDARPVSRYDQAHLPGAISISVPKLKKMKAAALPADKDKLLIFYCGGPTWGMSTANAGLAKKLGYNNVRAFLDGEPAWSKEGYPLYASNSFVEKGNIVLLDIREDHSPLAGRIDRAVAIPYGDLEDRLDDIPRNAPVVLYSDNMESVIDAYEDLKDEGFKHVSLVKGNYQGWVSRGGKTVAGPIFSTEIKWVRKLGKGEVSVAEFRKAVAGELKDVFVIDARTDEEIAELGIFKNTVNIPLDQIPNRLADIPKNKRVFIHCSTGARADLAYQELLKHGYDVKFLLLDISDPACDCEIIKPE